MIEKLEWAEFKYKCITTKQLSVQMEEKDVVYRLYAFDGPVSYRCDILKETPISVDQEEFETTYKALTNETISQEVVITDGEGTKVNQLDTDGAQIVRIKAAKKGWTYGAIPIEFKTGTTESFYSKLVDGTDRAGVSITFYDSDGIEIPEEDLPLVTGTDIIRTVVSFEPQYDYEVIGGALRIGSDIAFDCRLWIIAVPGIPAHLGGSKEMAGGLNLKFLAPQQTLQVDGRVSKTLIYNSLLHTNRLDFIFEHQADDQTDIHINIELFRP